MPQPTHAAHAPPEDLRRSGIEWRKPGKPATDSHVVHLANACRSYVAAGLLAEARLVAGEILRLLVTERRPRERAYAALSVAEMLIEFDAPAYALAPLEEAGAVYRAHRDDNAALRVEALLGWALCLLDEPKGEALLVGARRSYLALGDDASVARVDLLLARSREGSFGLRLDHRAGVGR